MTFNTTEAMVFGGNDFVCGAFNLAAIGEEASYMYPKGYLCSGRKSGETTSRAMLCMYCNSVCSCSALHGIELLMASRDQRSFKYMTSS